jgi:putative RecB family exonuclease
MSQPAPASQLEPELPVVPDDSTPLPVAIVGSLSPSRASDFKTCPLLYRFRSIDRLPETPTRDATRGTVVHAVLEHLYDLPAADRTLDRALASVTPQWQALLAERPELAQLFPDGPAGADADQLPLEASSAAAAPVGVAEPADSASAESVGVAEPADSASAESVGVAEPADSASTESVGVAEPADSASTELADQRVVEPPADSELGHWLASARQLVANYFELEDPRFLEPAAREELVEVVLDGLRLRGYIDRLDVSPAGDIRIVDYKTGSIPREAFEAKALFQMKFYALVLWRTRGVVPRQLRLMYLSDIDTLSYQPDEQELARFEKTLQAIWKAIATASLTGDFRASPSRLCGWCSHHQLCPAQGGTPPPFPAGALAGATEPATERDAAAADRLNAGSAELDQPSRAVTPVL